MALEETDEDSLQAWHDIGAKADLWGSIPSEPTCKAPNAKGATRRDDVIANSVGFGLVESFQVTWDDVYDVHATIRFTLNLEPLDVEKRVVNKAKSFHAKLDEMIRAEFGYNEEDAFDKNAWERWHWHLRNVHGFMEQCFAEQAEAIVEFLNKGDTTTFWIIWSDIVERSFIVGLGLDDDGYVGHGIFTTKLKKTHVPVYDPKTQTLQPNTANAECQRLLKQSRRLDQAACLLVLLENNPNVSKHQHANCMTSYGRHLGAMVADLNQDDATEMEFTTLLTEHIDSYAARLVQIAKHFHDRYLKHNVAYMKTVKDGKDEEIINNPLGKKTFKRIKGAIGSGLNALKRKAVGPLGQKIGTHTTDAFEIDQILIEVSKILMRVRLKQRDISYLLCGYIFFRIPF
jgi:hypothetical protein